MIIHPPTVNTEWNTNMAISEPLDELTVAEVMAGLSRWPSYQQEPWVRAAVDLLHAHNG